MKTAKTGAKMDRRTITLIGTVIAASIAVVIVFYSRSPETPTKAQEALAKLPPPISDSLSSIQPDEVVLGDASAPITMIEYASFSCPHCANFNKTVLPEIKRLYVETGKVKLVLRDFPLNRPAIEASLLIRCISPMAYWTFADQLFATQETWVNDNSAYSLAQMAAAAGIGPDAFQKCLEDEKNKKSIVNSAEQATKVFSISGTPTFVINGIVVAEDNSLTHLQGILDALLVKAQEDGVLDGVLDKGQPAQ